MYKYWCFCWLLIIGACDNGLIQQEEPMLPPPLEVIKRKMPQQVSYDLSMPIYKVENGQRVWGYHLLLVQDSTLESIVRTQDSSLVKDLVPLLKDERYAWQANIMLYALTQNNALYMESYKPNDYKAWLEKEYPNVYQKWTNDLENKLF